MRSIPFTCLLVLAVSGFCQGVSGLKPRMFPEKDEIILKEGDDLIIQCEGDRRLQFLPEEITDNPNLEYESSYDEGSRLHTFVFRNVSYLNSAWYACAEAGVHLKNNEQIIDHSNDDISWIYVYVKSSHPFPFENYVKLVPVMVGKTAVIPCRLTSPDLSVKLQVDFEDNEDPSISYVPKVGFILENVSVRLSGTSYGCIANISDTNYEMEALMTLHVRPAEPLPEPTIDEKSVRNVVWGENHTFICNTIMAPDSIFALGWKMPKSVPKSRISEKIFGPTELGYVAEKGKHSAELTVKDVEISDGGEYLCYIVYFHEGKTDIFETSVNITVSDPNEHFINVTIYTMYGANSSLTVLNESDTAKWMIMIDTYPPMTDWRWFKPNLEEIPKVEIGFSHTHKYSHSEENLDHFFRISNLELKDNGNYTLRVSTSKGTKDTILALRVDAKPLAVIENSPKYYAPGQSVIFTCEVLASPKPNITWIYLEYPNYPSKTPSRNATLGKTESKPVDGSPHIVKSSLILTLRKEGDLTCEACNSFGCNSATKPIFLSAADALFKLTIDEQSVRNVVWGENHTFICNITMAPDSSFALGWRTPESVPKSRISEKILGPTELGFAAKRTKHSAELTVKDIEISDGGEYVCYIYCFHEGESKKFETSVDITVSVRNTTFGFQPNAIEFMNRPTFVFYNIHIHLPNKSNVP